VSVRADQTAAPVGGVRRRISSWADKWSDRGLNVAVVVFVVLLTGMVLYPMLTLVARASTDFQKTLTHVIESPMLPAVMFNTFALGMASLVIALILGITLALCTARLHAKLQNFAILACVTPIILPPVAAVTGWTFIFAPTVGFGNVFLRAITGSSERSGPVDIYSIEWIIWITSLYLVGYVFMFVNAALRNINPAIEDAARLAGAGWWRAQITVILPAIRPAIFYSAVIAFLLGLGQFTAPILLGRARGIDVITTMMFREVASFPPAYEAASLLAMPLAALAIAVAFLQRRLIGPLARYSETGSKGATAWRPGNQFAALGPLAYGLVAVVPPLLALGVVSLMPFWTASVDPLKFTLRHFVTVLTADRFLGAIVDTVVLAAIGTLVGTILAIAAALVLVRKPSRLTPILDTVVNLPVAIPGIVLGLGMLLSFGLGPLNLYGNKILFIVAWNILYLPFGLRMAVSGLIQISPQLENAARLSGAGKLRAFAKITLPLWRNSLVTGAILLFILMSHEFSAAAMLRTSETQVMATRLYDVWETGTYPQVAALALVMVITSVLSVLLLLIVRGRRLHA